MYELGPGADAYHRAVGEHCAAAGVRLVAVGDLARDYLTGAPGERWFATVDECLAALPEVVPPGSAVLVKASRLMRMERVRRGARRRGRRRPCLGPWAPACWPWCWSSSSARRSSAGCALNEFGQNIREEGPEAHKTKEGTPTMGGVLIWFAVLIPYLVFSRFSVASLTVFIAALGNAGIGFADDWIKIVRKRSLGLSARYKLLLQLLLCAVHRLHRAALRRRHHAPSTCRSPRTSWSSAPSASTRSSS